jgi:signal recognition particle subunit SRP54
MFGALTEKFQHLFGSLTGKKTLTEENIADAIREVRLALLDADVNYTVVSRFIKRVKEKALGDKVLRSVTPGQQFIEVVHNQLIELMGTEEVLLDLKKTPSVLMLCGLQGSGKTTHAAKLARYILKQDPKKKILLAACDLQRPAAVEQLKRLGSQVGVDVLSIEAESFPRKVALAALEKVKKEGYDLLIVDTAGRLHLDEELMLQLEDLKKLLDPQEILFVASANTGQDAVKTAHEFDRRISITGTILTMLDGNSRAGAAISIHEVTGKPLKFEGIGEKIDDLQLFNPKSMADRILGMGDVVNLVRKAQEHFTEEDGKELEKKLLKASFTYSDYLKQMNMMKKMGSFKSLLKMLPGMPALDEMNIDEKEFRKTESMILSMTLAEREEKVELVPSRRRRIASGSGVHTDEVNRMIKSFKRMKQFFKDMPSLKKQFSKQQETGKKENFLWR